MMKIFIFFLICEVLCELPVSTVMPVLEPDEKVPSLEPETLTDLPIGAAEDFFSLTLNDEDIEIEANEVTTDAPITDPSVTITSTTTLHFLEAACDDKNMEWNTCGPRCYQTCAFQPRGVRRTRAVCETTMPTGCRPGCFCKKGYVRLNDKCVLSDDCPTRVCVFSNEEHKQCGTPCQITCDSYNRATEIETRCPTDICVRGCFCKAGFVRSATGLCVQPTRCPRPLVV